MAADKYGQEITTGDPVILTGRVERFTPSGLAVLNLADGTTIPADPRHLESGSIIEGVVVPAHVLRQNGVLE